jgi:endonuclease YncB( thermonuclease family)
LLSAIGILTDTDINNFFSSSKTQDKIVTKIIDGDTVIVEGGETIRLLGIDCDEKGKKCYANATKRIEELLLGKNVVIESGAEDKDQYDRSLRYIFLNEKNINVQMVEEGFCVARFVGSENDKYKSEIQEAESNAIKNKIGCKWSV